MNTREFAFIEFLSVQQTLSTFIHKSNFCFFQFNIKCFYFILLASVFQFLKHTKTPLISLEALTRMNVLLSFFFLLLCPGTIFFLTESVGRQKRLEDWFTGKSPKQQINNNKNRSLSLLIKGSLRSLTFVCEIFYGQLSWKLVLCVSKSCGIVEAFDKQERKVNSSLTCSSLLSSNVFLLH